MVKIGIIGIGYWGPNLVRNFSNQNEAVVYMVADSRKERLDMIKKNYPSILCVNNADEMINSSEIDAIVIATPVFTHFNLAKKALLNGKHVLLEKPMAETVAHCIELIDIANDRGLSLMVDHTFLYTGAVKKIKELIDSGEIGDVNYFDSTRLNLGLFQPDINVLWDLAPHDISILFYLLNQRPLTVSASGISHTPNGIENLAYLSLKYDSSHIAHFSCSWSSPVKIRRILIGGTKKMVLFDDIEPSEKVKIYDTGYKVKNDEEKQRLLVDYRVGDIYIPKLDQTEALGNMAKDFINSIIYKTDSISNYKIGLEVVKVLEAAQISISHNGNEVKIAF